MSRGIGADNEVGCLRVVLTHRPGRELSRITPRSKGLLRLPALPWTARAQREHDILTGVLRAAGVEVVYLTGLLQDVLEYSPAREEAIASVLANAELGRDLALALRRHFEALGPEDLALALTAGITTEELRTGRGLVYDLLDPRDFVVEPLPNLVFVKDSSTWIGDQVVVGALPGPRRRESDLLATVYGHHPRFAGQDKPFKVSGSPLDCGDLVLLGPGVVAVGIGPRSAPASVELLARHLLEAGKASCVLAVPIGERAGDSSLDMVCTVLGPGTVLMTPGLAFTLTAISITARSGNLVISRPRPFLEASARALGIGKLTVVGTGIDSVQWDDGGNALAVGGGLILCDERNSETNARLADAGFEVITVPGGELGGIRGGPRAMCTTFLRDSVRPVREVAGRESIDHVTGGTPSSEHTIPPRSGSELVPLC